MPPLRLALLLALLASSLPGCKSSPAPAPPTSTANCSALAQCCLTLSASEEPGCATTARELVDSACLAALSFYTSGGGCVGVVFPSRDAGQSTADATTGAGCGALAACCPTLPAADQPSCNAAVTLASASSCAQALVGFQGLGQCGGATVKDAGVVFSGPSCPPGTPPNSFVGADAGPNCVKCVNNCEVTNAFQTECGSYYGCYCACAAGDTGCQQACSPLEGSCTQLEADLETCISNDCASLCSTPATGACATLVACCEKLTDAGFGGVAHLGSCTALGHPDGGEARCQTEVSQLGTLCTNPP